MKPIEKYQEKFIALLKEAEEELGAPLSVTVKCVVTRTVSNTDLTAAPIMTSDSKEYVCDIGTSGRWF